MCHCRACQRRTGSVFGVQARFDQDAVTFEGEGKEYVRVGDEGCRITFHFCPGCGSTVWYTIDGMPDLVAIPVGAFADNTLPPPEYSVYEDRMHPWVVLPDDMEHFA
jgi:hypothetical protein